MSGIVLTDLGFSPGKDTRALRVDWNESAVARYAHQRIIEDLVRIIAEKIAADLYVQVSAAMDVRALANLVLGRAASIMADQFATQAQNEQAKR